MRFFDTVDKSSFELDGKRVSIERRKPNLLRITDCDIKAGSKGTLEVLLHSGVRVRFDVTFVVSSPSTPDPSPPAYPDSPSVDSPSSLCN